METRFIYLFIFILPLFNQVGKLRTSSHLQLRPGQDKAKQFYKYNNRVTHGVKQTHSQKYSRKNNYIYNVSK